MKKKKLLKRIEELEKRINNKNYYDWSKAIVDNRGKSAYVVCSGEYNVPLASKNENLNLMFPKYCKECKLPMKQKAEMLEDRSGIRVKYCFDIRKL